MGLPIVRGGYPMHSFRLNGLAKELLMALAERDIDAQTAADEIGIHASSLSRICRRGKMPDAAGLLKILAWLGYRIERRP